MKNLILLLIFFSISIQFSNAQEVVSSTFLRSYELEHFTEELDVPFSKHGVDLYRVNYTTKNLKGEEDIASGLICIPKIEGLDLPLVSYGHGTVGSRYDVPSYLSAEHSLPAIYSSMGTVCISADYLGLGINPGIHPYVHADSEAWASYDLMVAAKSFLSEEMDINLNDQLFVTGYSQGGHSAMALHRYLETETDIEVSLAMPMSGPYSISTGMKDLLISDDEYEYVSYLASTAVSYQEVYGTIFPNNDITQFFKQPYADIIQKYVTDESDLFQINEELIDALKLNEGGSFPKKMIFDDIVSSVLSDDNHPVNIALRDNDVYDWAPKADTRLLYCEADDQVAFQNSLIARDKMIENGAQKVIAEDQNSDFNHTECVTPAATKLVFHLLLFSSPTSTLDFSQAEFKVYPNPTQSRFSITSDEIDTPFNAKIYTMSGEQKYEKEGLISGEYLNVNLSAGIYILQLNDQNGKNLGYRRLVIL